MALSQATTVAYKYLAKYLKTQNQTRDYLIKKGFQPYEINEAIVTLIDLKVLDDRLYAEMYLSSEVVRKGKPILVVKQKLYHKGIDSDITQELIDEHHEEYQSGMFAALEKLRAQKNESDDTQKWIKRMISRGYDYDLVRSVVGDYHA